MVTVFLEVIMPAVVLLIVFFALRLYSQIQSPSPLALGCIIPKVCVVGSAEILRYNKKGDDEQAIAKHLRREVLWKQFRVNWGYLCEEASNTTLFQRALRFEKIKIDPTKSALQYEQREVLILELVDQADDIRWTLFRAQVTLLSRTMLGLSIDQSIFITLLGRYKKLEEDIVALAGMAEDDCYRLMLMERLGLNSWGLHEGGSIDPA